MSEQHKHDSTPLRLALRIFCIVTFYLGTVFAISLAFDSVSNPRPYPPGSKDAADFAARHPLSPRLLIFDHPLLDDLMRRLIVAGVLVAGGAGLLIAGRLVGRRRSPHSTPTG